MKKHLLVMVAILALLIACTAFSVGATATTPTSDNTTPTLDNTTPVAFDPDTMTCPHCDTLVPSSEWVEFTDSTTSRTGHFKITREDGLDLTALKQFGDTSAVIWINTEVRAKNGTNAFRVGDGDSIEATLWLLGGANGVIVGSGATTTGTNGSLMRTFADGTLHIGGALTVRLSGAVSARMGGLMDLYGTVIMHDGTLEGICVADTAADNLITYGAVVVNGGTFTMKGGRIIGGGAKYGAAVYVNNAAASAIIEGDAYIEGSGTGDNNEIYVNKGSATIRGNAYIKGNDATSGTAVYNAAGTLTISGGTIHGGTATNGGAVYLAGGTTTISGGTIHGGTATNGGAIYVAGGTLTMQSDADHANGGTVNGSVAEKGGAIYLDEDASFTMTAGTVNGCTITDTTETVVLGGAIYINTTDADALTFTGGTVNGGTVARVANTEQGITAVNGLGGALYVKAGTVSLAGTDIIGGTAYQGGCIYMAAGTLTVAGSDVSEGSALHNGGAILAASGTLNISSGSVSGGNALNWGGNIQSGATVNITGGSVSSGNAKRGGNIYAASGLHMSGGTVEDGTATQYAGNIFMAGNVTYSITGGTIEDGTSQGSYYGGNVHIYNGTLSIADTADKVIIQNGSAANGGNISVSRKDSSDVAEVTINLSRSDSLISGGTATNGAGIYSQGTLTIIAGTVTGGTATSGGAIYVADGELTLGGANLVGGKAKEGGVIFIDSAGTVNMTAGNISLGDATSNGGTVFINGGTMDMSGGILTANPKNTYSYSKGIRVVNGTLNLSGNARVISAGGSEGNAVYAVSTNKNCLAKVTLSGSASVTNPDGSQTCNIFLSNYGPNNSTTRYSSKIEVAAGWSGTASVKFGYIYSDSYAMPDAEYSIGMTFPAAYAAATGDFTGTLYMEVAPDTPTLWWDGATGLKASDVQICVRNGVTEDVFWAKNNAAAVADYEDGYIKLYNSDALDLNGKTVYVDFNGNSTQVSLNGGKLYGFDSTATTSVAGTSAVTVSDGDAQLYGKNPVTGQYCFALKTGGITSFHAVQVGINAVSLRPGNAGLYYSAQFLCDSTLQGYVDSFGVALSLNGMPGADFAEDNTVLYTANGKEKLGAESYNSVLIHNIMNDQRTAEQNKSYAEMPIYANSYIRFTVEGNTVVLMADEHAAELSLKDVLQRINSLWLTLDQSDCTSVIEKLYDPYISEFEENDWNLFHIESEKNGQNGTNKELKILTIGNSLSVDAGRMLAYVAQQEGSEGIKVGTLYKANCSVQEHADFLVNNKPNYWYYESGFDVQNPGALTTGSLVPRETKQYVGYDALVAEDWDIIIMQHSVFGSAKPDTYDESIDVIIDYVNAHKTNPNAILAWNMTWMGPVDNELLATAATSSPGFDKSYISYTKDPLDREAQTMMYEMISDAVYEKILPDSRFVYILPSATMMQNALTATSDKVMYRDYIHGSDYGRLMNAYLWYSMLTGKSITEPAVDVIPGALRQATANQSNDLTLTQRMKDILAESVNNAINNPFEETVSQYQKKESLKVLAIGNSFSVDAMWHLEEVARSEGYTDVKIATLYIGGCTLKTHWAKAEGDLADYTYYYNYDGNWKNTANYKISQALSEQDWDIITLQQASGGSGQASTYEPYLENMITYLQTNAPTAKILWHMTWAYSQDSTHSDFSKYDGDQTTMYNAIVGAVDTAVVPYVTAGDIAAVIPSGTAMQNVRTSYVGDEVDRDGYHLNLTGRIVAACTWYSVLTDNQLDELNAFYFADHYMSGKPTKTLTDADRAMIVEAVNHAIENPYQVTNSVYVEE